MQNINIVFRSCDRVECVSGSKRLVDVTKSELILRCLNSLVSTEVDIDKMIIVDDHSKDETLDCMLGIVDRTSIKEVRLVSTKTKGNGVSLRTTYETAKEHCEGLIYFVEDDYLHEPGALQEMVELWDVTTEQLGHEVIVHPCDYPDRYSSIYWSFIILGEKRHWRSIHHTTGTFLLDKGTLLRYWDHYMEFTKYGEVPGVSEDTSINKIYEKTTCFSPIPSLATHLQYKSTLSPFVDWEKTWDDNKVYSTA